MGTETRGGNVVSESSDLNPGAPTRYPLPPSNKGKRRSAKRPDGSHFYFTIEDEFYVEHVGEKSNKLIYLQRLKLEKDGRIQLRLGYYAIGEKPRMCGRWVWGQFAPMMSVADFRKIIDIVDQKRWLS